MHSVQIDNVRGNPFANFGVHFFNGSYFAMKREDRFDGQGMHGHRDTHDSALSRPMPRPSYLRLQAQEAGQSHTTRIKAAKRHLALRFEGPLGTRPCLSVI